MQIHECQATVCTLLLWRAEQKRESEFLGEPQRSNSIAEPFGGGGRHAPPQPTATSDFPARPPAVGAAEPTEHRQHAPHEPGQTDHSGAAPPGPQRSGAAALDGAYQQGGGHSEHHQRAVAVELYQPIEPVEHRLVVLRLSEREPAVGTAAHRQVSAAAA